MFGLSFGQSARQAEVAQAALGLLFGCGWAGILASAPGQGAAAVITTRLAGVRVALPRRGMWRGRRGGAHESRKLEKLCRYFTRPAISEKRRSISLQGRVRYALKTPWRNGTTHVEFEHLI